MMSLQNATTRKYYYTENFFLVVTLKFHDMTTKCYDRGTSCRVMPDSAQRNSFLFWKFNNTVNILTEKWHEIDLVLQ